MALTKIFRRGSELRICYGIFHIENSNCSDRHDLKDKLVNKINGTWTNFNFETYSFNSLEEAEELAMRLDLNFNHIPSERKDGSTGFSKGEIGLWIGTITSLRRFVNSDFDILIIFEDDILVNESGILTTNSYLQKPPRKFDIFSLYAPEDQYFIYGRKKHPISFIQKHTIDNPRKPTRVFQDCSTVAYAVSKKGARKILKSIEKEISMPVDWHVYKNNFRAFSFKPKGPKPFSRSPVESTIQF